ncbi:hypothetical protein BH11BAC1_BH11BAC1_00700 [soil metagenome]
MNTIEVQDFIHVYCMFSFRDGRKLPGIIVNKYNVAAGRVEYFFINQSDMATYRAAFDNYDRESCSKLSQLIKVEDILNIRPVSLADYKMTMQLLTERSQLINAAR